MKSQRSRLVLLVGGDLTIARSCARAATPLPVIRAKRAAVAAEHLRSMQPVAVVLAADVTEEDGAHLARIADGKARVVHLRGSPEQSEEDLDAEVRRAVAHR